MNIMNNKILRYSLTFTVFVSLVAGIAPVVGVAQTAPARATSDAYAKALEAIEAKADARRKELGIPGMALVIVKDDQVIYAKGLGLKNVEKQEAVTPDTQFAIASATKAFTALSVLMAQDDGKLSLDDSPKKYLPYFKMYDPDTDRQITLRDLLSHSSGLNRTDLAMITGRLNRDELIEVSARAKPTAKLREKFQYQNIMFVAAGEAVAKANRTTWEKFVPERIFKPLGMTNSSMSMAQMSRSRDHSLGYDYNFDTKETLLRPYREITASAPAGSITSSANDMAKWLRFVLNGGTVGGKRLVSEKGFEEWLKPQMKITPNGVVSYGLGWFIEKWNGLKVVHHGGNIDGFNSLVAMIPEKKLGFVMLTNVSGSPLGNELMPLVWSNLIPEAVPPPPPPVARNADVAPEKEAGKYKFAEAGIDVDITFADGKLTMNVPGQPAYPLEKISGRKYKLTGAPEGFFVTFRGDELYLEQPQGNFTLKRAGTPSPASSAVVAANLVGKYTAAGAPVELEIKADDKGLVTLNLPGQQPYALTPKGPDTFSLKPLPDSYSLRAKYASDGKAASVVITQPEGDFEFKRSGEASEAPSISVEELHKKVIEAAGGEAALRAITSRVTEADVDFESQGVTASATSWLKAPARNATEVRFTALGKVIATGWEFFDGTRGEQAYSFAPVERLAGKNLEDKRLEADLYSILDWTTPFRRVAVTGTAKVGGEDAFVVSFESEKGTPFKEYYSTTTFLLLKREGVNVSSTSSQQVPYTTLYSDYRRVDGVMLPFRSVNSSITMGDVVTVLRSVKHNTPVDDAIFAPRKVN